MTFILGLILGSGAAAQICNDALEPEMGILGKIRVNNENTSHVAVEGDTAFMASSNFVYAVDVSNPASLIIIGQYPAHYWKAPLAVSGGLICLGDYHDGLRFLDATDPGDMVPVKTIPEITNTAFVLAHGDFFYVAGDYGLTTVDASDPSDPVVTSVLNPGPRIHRLAIKGDLLYSAGYGDPMCVFNIGDPGQPDLVYEAPGYLGSDLEIVGDYLYRTSAHPNRWYMAIYRILPDSGLPGYVRTQLFDFEIIKVTSIGDTLFCSGDSVINALDLSDPENPQPVGQMSYDKDIHDMVPYGDVLLCHVQDHILMTVELGKPEPPVLANLWGPAAPAMDFQFHDDLYFWGAANEGLQVWEYDSYPPSSVVALSDTLHAIKRVGDLLYLAIDEDGLQIADISDPAGAVLVGGVNSSSQSRDVDVYTNDSGTYALLAIREQDLIKYDVTDPANISFFGLNSFPGFVYAVEVVGDHLLVADTWGHLNVMDLSVFPDQPEVVAVLDLPGGAYSMQVEGNLCYVGGDSFLAVVDISDPAVPVLLGSTGTLLALVDLVIEGTLAYGILDGYGLVAIEVGDPTDPFVRCETPAPSEPFSVATYGGKVYVSTLEYGLVSMPLETSTSVTAVESPSIAANPEFEAYPNPFNPRTTVRFESRSSGPAHLAVYDLAGRKVAEIVDGWLDAGIHERAWDGRDRTGRPASSGQYLVRLKTLDGVSVQKVLLAK